MSSRVPGSYNTTLIHFGPERYGESYAATRRRFPIAPIAAGLALTLVLGAGGAGAAYVFTHLPAPVEQAAAAEPAPEPAPPPPGPPGLQSALAELADSYGEPVGIAVTNVDTGWLVAVNGAEAFPQQSVSKLWVAIAALDAVDHGELTLDQDVEMGPADRSVFTQPLAYLIKDGKPHQTTVRGLLRAAIVKSDNAANDKLVSLIGIDRVERVIADKKLAGIRVGEDERHLQARIAGLVWQDGYGFNGEFEQARAKLPMARREWAMQSYIDDPADGATPAAITDGLARLKRGELLSPASTAFLIETMSDVTTGPKRLKGGLPTGWSAAHKTGTGQDLNRHTFGYNDVGLITAPDGATYSVAVMMRKTGKPIPQRLEFMQAVSGAIARQWSSQAQQSAAAGQASSES